jgi:tol-pal system protein YbgF
MNTAACATYGDLTMVKDDLIRIEEKINQLHKKVGAQAGGGSDVGLRNQAEIISRIEELKNEFQSIKGNLEKSNFKLAEISYRLDTLQARITGEPLPAITSLPKPAPPSAIQPTPPSTPLGPETPTTSPPAPPPIVGINPETIYHTAYNDYVRGNYSLAILGFKEFLKKFPQAEFSPNAQYWLGECYYSLKDYETAIKEFDRAATNYPESSKTPGALLKMSYSLAELQRSTEAQAKLNEVVDKYPNSPEADQARERLRSMEQ